MTEEIIKGLQGYNKYSNNKNEFEVEVKSNIAKLVNKYSKWYNHK